MKTYTIEPTMKKSIVEIDIFQKGQGEGKPSLVIRKEIGWRWGDFDIHVPETEEEVIEWANFKTGEEYYKSLEEVLVSYDVKTLEEMIQQTKPNPDDIFHELDEYQYDMNSTWDGCWQDWDIVSGGDEMSEEEQDKLLEEVEEAYDEEYEDGVMNLGFEHTGAFTEIHCPITMEEVSDKS